MSVHVHVQAGGEHGVSFLRCHSLGFCDTESLLGLVLAKSSKLAGQQDSGILLS